MKTFILLVLFNVALGSEVTPPLAIQAPPISIYSSGDSINDKAFKDITSYVHPVSAKSQYEVKVEFVIESTEDQVKKLIFYYDNEVSVFVNDVNLYVSNKTYEYEGGSDSLYCPLKKGKNKILLKGYQRPGSIGIRGQWEDMNGINF